MQNAKHKEEAARQTILEAHKGLANIYRHRLFQYIRPEFCMKLETTTEKHGAIEYYVELLGYYHGSLPGIVIYKQFEDYLSMIYKEQTIDNLAAVKKAEYIVFLAKNHKTTNESDKKKEHQNSPYCSPQSRVSASHWNMIKQYHVCAKYAQNPKLPMIPCFTPRLDKLIDPQLTLHSLVWICHALHHLFIHIFSKKHNNAYNIDNHKIVYDKYSLNVSFPYGLNEINTKKLCLRPWLKTLPYIFNTMKNCGDGLTYFEKKLAEAETTLISRKVPQDNYFLDPSGIDYVTAIKGIVGVYMKMGVLHSKYYALAVNDCLNKALLKDSRDTLKCRNLKLKCLLYNHQYIEYLEELKKEKFYDEKKLHRIDGTLSWNITFCSFKLYGNKHEKTVESIKKSIQNHCSVLYVLLSIKSGDCKSMRNQRDLNRHLTFYYEYGQFWISQYSVFQFVINDVLYYYLDSKSRPVHHFLSSKNRVNGNNEILTDPRCINTNCPNRHELQSDTMIQCKLCRVAFFCSEECEDISVKHKKHAVECEMIKKTKRIYTHFVDNVFKEHTDKETEEKKDINDDDDDSGDDIEDQNDDRKETQFVWGDHEESSLASFMEELQENNLVNVPANKAQKERKKRKSVENVKKDKTQKKKGKKKGRPTPSNKRRGSVELEFEV